MGLCAILSNVEEVIEQKPAEKENRREQRHDVKYLILFFASEAMSLDLCYSHIRAGDRCAIYSHVICVSENDSIGGLQVRIHLGAKNKLFNFGGAGVTVAILFLMRGTKLGPPCFLSS